MAIDLSPRVRLVTVETDAPMAAVLSHLVIDDPDGGSWILEFEPDDRVVGARAFDADGVRTIELTTVG
jgi:hypothetical protein